MALPAEMVGHCTPPRKVDFEACMRVGSLLGRMPATRCKHYEKLSVKDAIKAAEALQIKPRRQVQQKTEAQ